MQLAHVLTRSGLTCLEFSSKVYHDSLCQSDSSVSLPWVIYFEAFYLHAVSSFSCIPVICPKNGVNFISFAICAFVLCVCVCVCVCMFVIIITIIISSSSSPYVCHAVGPRVNPFRSHVFRISLQRSTTIPSASRTVVFHYPG